MNEEAVEYVLKDFPGTRYYPKFKLTTWHPQGTFEVPLAEKILTFIEWEEYIEDAPFDRYTDLSGITRIRMGIGSMIEIARRRRYVREPVKSAIFGHDRAGLELAQCYERLMHDASMIRVRSFSERKAAAEWLEVPEPILRPSVQRQE
jgi:hypothetical protein